MVYMKDNFEDVYIWPYKIDKKYVILLVAAILTLCLIFYLENKYLTCVELYYLIFQLYIYE